MSSTKLLIKNLPPEFTDADKTDFLKLFGACEVIPLGNFGKMRNCCYVSFPDTITTKQALDTLHQFEVLDKRIVAEYAKTPHEKLANQVQSKDILEKKIDTINTKSDQEKEKETKDETLTAICPKLNVKHAFPAHLTYKYPDPNIAILTNIANAMATVPKFYIQVLHLMNKMNLPAPFGGPTLSPPIAGDSVTKHDVCTDTLDLQDFFSDESELESDTDTKKPEIYQSQPVEPERKRKRLKALNKVNQAKFHIVPLKKTESVSTAFELTMPNKVEFNLANSIKDAVERTSHPAIHFNVFDERGGGFGIIEPLTKVVPMDEQSEGEDEEELSEEDDEMETEYITLKQLQEYHICESEILSMAQFKNYERGNKTNRLYIKNLAKQVTVDDLKFIFKRFIRKCTEEEKENVDFRLMQEGRMKGQAFVTLPTEDIAEQALTLTHGYVLHDKPMVIQYGRTGK